MIGELLELSVSLAERCGSSLKGLDDVGDFSMLCRFEFYVQVALGQFLDGPLQVGDG